MGTGGVPAGIDFDQLSVIERILVTTDGTVTHIIEAYAGEPIYAQRLCHKFIANEEERLSFGLNDGERALRRTVLLRGAVTDRPFLHAECAIMLDRLPASVERGMLTSETPIGKLLRSSRLESFREIISCSEHSDATVAGHFKIEPSAPLLSRTYRILVGGRPVAWITETFPRASFVPVVDVAALEPSDVL